MNNKGKKEKKNQSNQIIKFDFDPSYAMGPLVDLGIISVKDTKGRRARILCTDAHLKEGESIVAIVAEIGLTTYHERGKYYEAADSEYDLHLEYDLGFAKKEFGYDILGAINMANDVFGDPDQYGPAEQRMILEMCAMLMS